MDTFYILSAFVVGLILGATGSFFIFKWRAIAHLTIEKIKTEDGELIFQLKNLAFQTDANKLSKKHAGMVAIHTTTKDISQKNPQP